MVAKFAHFNLLPVWGIAKQWCNVRTPGEEPVLELMAMTTWWLIMGDCKAFTFLAKI